MTKLMKSIRFQPGLYDILLGILIVLMVLAIIIARAPYLHDFAEWLYQGQIVKQILLNPAAVSHFTMASYPVPNSLATMLLTGLSFVFAPFWAGKAFLILMLLAWFWVIRLFSARFVDPQWRGAASLVLYASTGLTTFFWHGFVSYQLALFFLTWFFAIYRQQTSGVVVAVFGLAIFFSHAIIFLVYGLVLGIRLLLRWDKTIVAGLLPATLCSLWFLVGRHLAQVEPQRIDAIWSGLREALSYKAAYPVMLGPFKNFVLPGGTSLLENHAWIYWLGVIGNIAVVAMLAAIVLGVCWKYLKDDQYVSSEVPLLRATWAISMLLIVLFYLLAPYHFFGVINSGGRVLTPLLLMAFMLGGVIIRPLVRILVWPVILFSLLTVSSYFYLMLQTQQPEFSLETASVIHGPPSGSVLDYNQQRYASTRYKYFNYPIFAYAHRFRQIETKQFQGLTFRHAMLIDARRKTKDQH